VVGIGRIIALKTIKLKPIHMKKLFCIFAIAQFILACNNSSESSTTSADSTTAPNSTNVGNVNGNVPDTTSGMTLNQSLPVDSSNLKDSTRH
jgi:hypothetical protein